MVDCFCCQRQCRVFSSVAVIFIVQLIPPMGLANRLRLLAAIIIQIYIAVRSEGTPTVSELSIAGPNQKTKTNSPSCRDAAIKRTFRLHAIFSLDFQLSL